MCRRGLATYVIRPAWSAIWARGQGCKSLDGRPSRPGGSAIPTVSRWPVASQGWARRWPAGAPGAPALRKHHPRYSFDPQPSSAAIGPRGARIEEPEPGRDVRHRCLKGEPQIGTISKGGALMRRLLIASVLAATVIGPPAESAGPRRPVRWYRSRGRARYGLYHGQRRGPVRDGLPPQGGGALDRRESRERRQHRRYLATRPLVERRRAGTRGRCQLHRRLQLDPVRNPGNLALLGGGYDRSAHPWVTFGPDGVVHRLAVSFDDIGPPFTARDFDDALLASKSEDGGLPGVSRSRLSGTSTPTSSTTNSRSRPIPTTPTSSTRSGSPCLPVERGREREVELRHERFPWADLVARSTDGGETGSRRANSTTPARTRPSPTRSSCARKERRSISSQVNLFAEFRKENSAAGR
jgi:hypothetical protein